MENSQYFNKVDLVIERTSNGLGYDYISQGLRSKDLARLRISFDETNQVGQFNSGYCYSIQRTEHYLIYSVINTDQKDNANRKGFFAVRLIVGSNDLIENVHVNLGKVTQVYLDYLRDNSINHQNYDHILSEVAKNVKRKSSLAPRIILDNAIYYQFVNLPDIQSELFNDPRLCFTNKVYFLNDKSGVADDVPRQFGFEPLVNYWSKVREIQFLNPERLNLSISIDNNSYSAGAEKFLVVCRATDVVKYKLPHQPNTTVGFSEKTVSIKRPEVTISLNGNNSHHGSLQEQKSSSTLLGIGCVLLGLVGGYFAHPYLDEFLNETQYESAPVSQTKKIDIEIDTAAENVIHFVDRSEQINHYVFKYEGKSRKWSYRNTNVDLKPKDSSFKPLTSASLNTLLNGQDELVAGVKEKLQSFISMPIPDVTEEKQPANSSQEASSTELKHSQSKVLKKDQKDKGKPTKVNIAPASPTGTSTIVKPSVDAKTSNKIPTSN